MANLMHIRGAAKFKISMYIHGSDHFDWEFFVIQFYELHLSFTNSYTSNHRRWDTNRKFVPEKGVHERVKL